MNVDQRGSTEIPSINELAQLMEGHQLKFHFNPRFAPAYDCVRSPPTDSDPASQSTTTTAHHFPSPPFDWDAMNRRLIGLDPIGVRLLYSDLSRSFRYAYEEINRQCDPVKTGSDPDVRMLAKNVQLMTRLSINMLAVTERGLKHRLRSDEVISKLQDCMSLLCRKLWGYNRWKLAVETNSEERQKIWEDLRMVDGFLKAHCGEAKYGSELTKVMLALGPTYG